MRYFIIALFFIAAVSIVHTMLQRSAPDRSVEAGLQRSSEEHTRQSQEEHKSIWDTQRETNRNNVPRR